MSDTPSSSSSWIGCRDYSNQRLTNVPTAIKFSKAVQSLNLCSNNICAIQVDNLIVLKNLRHLNLSKNMLKEFPICLSSLQRLENLDLSRNLLTELNFSFMINQNYLSDLQQLNASHNQISNLYGLNCLISLESIDVSNNALIANSFLDLPLKSLHMLRFVDLRNNLISGVVNLSKWLPRCIEALFLDCNYIHTVSCLYPLSTFTNLKALGVSNNPGTESTRVTCSSLNSYLLFLMPSLVAINSSPIDNAMKNEALFLFKKLGDNVDNEIDWELLALVSLQNEEELLIYLNNYSIHSTEMLKDNNSGMLRKTRKPFIFRTYSTKAEKHTNEQSLSVASSRMIDDTSESISSRSSRGISLAKLVKDLEDASAEQKIETMKRQDTDIDENSSADNSATITKSSDSQATIKNESSEIVLSLSTSFVYESLSLPNPVSSAGISSLNFQTCLENDARKYHQLLKGIVSFQALWRGFKVKLCVHIYRLVSNAAARIQSAYRRYRVMKLIISDAQGFEVINA